MKEIWKDIKGKEGAYMISNLGRVKSLERIVEYNDGRSYIKPETILNSNVRNKYLRVNLSINGIDDIRLVHRLVAKAFIPNPDNKPHVNHIDGNKDNPVYNNLEWCTHQENIIHAYKTGLMPSRKGMNAKPIIAVNFKNGLVMLFNSAVEAAKIGFNTGHIASCCTGRLKHHKGYYWMHVEEGDSN